MPELNWTAPVIAVTIKSIVPVAIKIKKRGINLEYGS